MGQPRTYTLYELEAESGFDKRTITYYISMGLLPRVGRRGPKTTYPQEFHDRLMFVKRTRDLQDDGQLRAVTLNEIGEVMRDLSADDYGALARGERSDDWIRELFVEPDWDTSGMAAEVATDYGDIPLGRAVDRTDTRSARMASLRQRRRQMRMRPEPSGKTFDWADAGDRSAPADTTDDAFGEQALDPTFPEPAAWSAELSLGSDRADDAELLERLSELSRIVQARAGVGAQSTSDYSGERLIRVPITDDIMLSVRNVPEGDAQLVEDLADLLRQVMRMG
ncbi:MAG: hypothetical protein KJO76_07855 [Gammaproteobacteria bacterium]|nr:hypothetical protein [Gammaproteobacteria bacterium]NND36751.1 hypothetical protein [Gammaproteobacteria bacterium]